MTDYRDDTIADLSRRLMEAHTKIGKLAGTIDMSLLDFKYRNHKRGIARMQKTLDEYNAEQEATYIRLGLKTAPVTA